MNDRVKFDLKGLALVLLAGIGGVLFCSGALANDDPLWFWPFFNETPSHIVVHLNGCDVRMMEGSPGFPELVGAINQSLSQVDGYEHGFGLSPQSLKDYRTIERSLEIFYPKPIRVHAPFRSGHPDSLLMPLTGPFGEARSLFGGRGGDYWGGALRLKTTDPVRREVEKMRCGQ